MVGGMVQALVQALVQAANTAIAMGKWARESHAVCTQFQLLPA